MYGGISDLCRFQIPNWISLVIVAGFLPAAVGLGWSMGTVGLHFGAGFAMLILGVILFSLNVFGGGDAKLLAAIAVWTGWGPLPFYLLMVALAGGALTLLLIVFRRLSLPAMLARYGWVHRLHSEEIAVPYGVAIAAVAVAMLPGLSVATAGAG